MLSLQKGTINVHRKCLNSAPIFELLLSKYTITTKKNCILSYVASVFIYL